MPDPTGDAGKQRKYPEFTAKSGTIYSNSPNLYRRRWLDRAHLLPQLLLVRHPAEHRSADIALRQVRLILVVRLRVYFPI